MTEADTHTVTSCNAHCTQERMGSRAGHTALPGHFRYICVHDPRHRAEECIHTRACAQACSTCSHSQVHTSIQAHACTHTLIHVCTRVCTLLYTPSSCAQPPSSVHTCPPVCLTWLLPSTPGCALPAVWEPPGAGPRGRARGMKDLRTWVLCLLLLGLALRGAASRAHQHSMGMHSECQDPRRQPPSCALRTPGPSPHRGHPSC